LPLSTELQPVLPGRTGFSAPEGRKNEPVRPPIPSRKTFDTRPAIVYALFPLTEQGLSADPLSGA